MSGVFYNTVAVIIFVFVAINFLFPCNRIIPLDRRTTSVLGAVLCYLTRRFLFPTNNMDVLHSVDFDVMILLSSIMVINHLVIHLKETKDVIEYLQRMVQDDPNRGLWVISLAAFLTSPFLTNDGVCLLFVEPILNAFEHAPFAAEITDLDEINNEKTLTLRKEDAMYFLLALACSANIGSALTYTGNPQNMIVASDSLDVLPSYKFLLYMIPASLFSWVVTMLYIIRCWKHSRTLHVSLPLHGGSSHSQLSVLGPQHARRVSHIRKSSRASSIHSAHSRQSSLSSRPDVSPFQIDFPALTDTAESREGIVEANAPSTATPSQSTRHSRPSSAASAPEPPCLSLSLCSTGNGTNKIPCAPADPVLSPLSPRRRKALQRAKNTKRITRIVTSPFPYLVLILLAAMIVMIFVDVMPISGLICVFAISMVVIVVMGNHWRDRQVWIEEEDEEAPVTQAAQPLGQSLDQHSGETYSALEDRPPRPELSPGEAVDALEEDLGPMTQEDKLDNLNQFFEALFRSIDYSLLIIFLGLFIVVENMSSTGIPERVWNRIVGPSPFTSTASIAGISLFVLISSQFLGNVAVIQLAKPNVEDLGDDTKRLAWAVISFVATVGGNLTITGSAANIIVAEKAARLDATMAIDFFRHYRVCFWVTLLSCAVGGCMITVIALADNATGSQW